MWDVEVHVCGREVYVQCACVGDRKVQTSVVHHGHETEHECQGACVGGEVCERGVCVGGEWCVCERREGKKVVCVQSHKLFIMDTNVQSLKLFLMDARPSVNAVANKVRAWEGGVRAGCGVCVWGGG